MMPAGFSVGADGQARHDPIWSFAVNPESEGRSLSKPGVGLCTNGVHKEGALAGPFLD